MKKLTIRTTPPIVAWAQAVKAGIIPGETISHRAVQLVCADLKRNEAKLRKAGVKLEGIL